MLMLPLDTLLDDWRRRKGGGHFYRLAAAREVAFEFRGPQPGHPSNYAAVRIAAEPRDELKVEWTAELPSTMAPDYRNSLALAVGHAAIDELVAADWIPFRGCLLTVREIGWDDAMSSEVAVYKAARGALAILRLEGEWRPVVR